MNIMKKSRTTKLTGEQVKHIAKLASLPLTSSQEKTLQKTLTGTLEYVSKIKSLKTQNVPETHQVTNLKNITRADKIDTSRMLSQPDALKNSPKTHNGYFVVKAIFE